jgi:hypothetical protein
MWDSPSNDPAGAQVLWAIERPPLRAARHIERTVLLALVALGLCWLAWVLVLSRHLPPHRVKAGPGIVRVLFIGDSYTYVNNLPGLVMALSAGEPKPLDAEMVVEGGATLDQLWAEGKALAAIRRGNWDYVVLQEQSTLGSGLVMNGIQQIGDPSAFEQSVRRFDTAIGEVGATTVLYLTWARQNAPQTQDALNTAYLASAKDVHAVIAPVGPAWELARESGQGWDLYQGDGSHPSPAGSYLAACVFYATFYGKSPEGLPARISSRLVDASGTLQTGSVSLAPADALALQQFAVQAVAAQR